jgi:hypothetical protein
MVGQHAGNLPRTHLRGLGSTCSFPAPPPTDRHLALDQLHGRRGGERGAAAWTPAKRRPRCGVDPRASHARPTFDHPFPARPDSGSDDQAAHRPATRPTCCAQRGLSSPHRWIPSPARCGQRGCSGRGHRTGVRPDTRIMPDAWTPDAWTPDVHPTSWTDVRPHGGQRTQTERRTAWSASRHPGRPRRRRPPDGRPTSSGCSVCGARQPMTAPR